MAKRLKDLETVKYFRNVKFKGGRRFVLGVAALVVVALALSWGFSSSKKRSQHRAIVAAVKDTTIRLRDALTVSPSNSGSASLPKVDAHVKAVEAHLQTVRDSVNKEHAELADGAEHYVLGAREIMRRQALSIRLSEQSSAARNALTAHMRRAASRDANWISDAASSKKRLEREYFEQNITLTALADLLWTFPDARKRLAPHVDHVLLLEMGPAEDARRLAQRESKKIALELEDVRRLALPH